MAGRLQASHPNPCRLAPSGYFGSKFVTVVVTGKENGEIDFRGYQISNQVSEIFIKNEHKVINSILMYDLGPSACS